MAYVQGRRQRQVWTVVCDWVLLVPSLRISAAGAHISREQAVVGVPLCCVVVVGKESRFGVRERRDHWGREQLLVLVIAVGSAPRAVGALGCGVGMCDVGMS